FKLPARAFLERLFILQCYLPSELSYPIKMSFVPPDNNHPSKLILESEANEKTQATIKKVVNKLYKATHLMKAIPIAPLLRLQLPGKGAHCGGSLPMRTDPGQFETDILGRPAGLR